MAIKVVALDIEVFADTADEAVQLVRLLRPDIFGAPDVPQPPPPKEIAPAVAPRARDHSQRRGLPQERPGERRCGNCGSVGHRRDRCPASPLRDTSSSSSSAATPAPPPPAPAEERVCAVHEAPATPVGQPKPNGRQKYTCELGCETENTILRRRKATA